MLFVITRSLLKNSEFLLHVPVDEGEDRERRKENLGHEWCHEGRECSSQSIRGASVLARRRDTWRSGIVGENHKCNCASNEMRRTYIRPTATCKTLSCTAKSVKPFQSFLALRSTSSPARIKLSPLSWRSSCGILETSYDVLLRMYNVIDVVTVDGRCTRKRLLAGSRRQRLSASEITLTLASCGKPSTSATPTSYFPSVLHSHVKKERVFRCECRSVTIFRLVVALSLELDCDCIGLWWYSIAPGLLHSQPLDLL